MEFRTVDNSAKEIIHKGTWMPLFKSRFSDNYYDQNKRSEYETNLRNKIFKNNSDIVISKNGYPFNIGDNYKQYVIWIKDYHKDPGLKEIIRLIEEKYPSDDYIIYINLYEHRSIKSILHYHAILKQPSEPSFLEKLVVFHRHGNREPILKIPIFENKIKHNYQHNDAVLLQIGHKNAYDFGSDLKKIYKMDEKFLSKSVFLSSPVIRCTETIQNIINSLGIKKNIVPSEELKFGICDELNSQSEKNILFRKEYEAILNELDNKFGMAHYFKSSPRRLMDLYDYHSSVQCYRDMGANIEEILDKDTEEKINIASKEIYNMTSHYNQKVMANELVDIILGTLSIPTNLVVCSTHDTLIFVLVKYIASKNNIVHNFDLPHYLSNFRIEKWSNGIIRIFYNNCYLGSSYE